MKAIVLGAAAGGGFPQWNCRCPICRLAWEGDPRVMPRTQASLAVSADGRDWVLLNASPDLRAQIQVTPALQPQGMPRGSPIGGVVLTGAEVDQVAGLLTLRERGGLTVYATSETLAAIADNPIFDVLAADVVQRRPVALAQGFALPNGLQAELFAVPGKVALYLEKGDPELVAQTGVNVGVEITRDGVRLVYVPGAAAITVPLLERLRRANVVLFDGTLFDDCEMIVSGTGTKSGRRMGHIPLDGADGTLQQLSGVAGRCILTHINNTNPILVDGSPQRRKVEAAGFEVARDGMEISL
ncbi:MAG: pyrroloquinoline quinone biosynthesis protein PqqB [Xanthobacteraceae bacterium]